MAIAVNGAESGGPVGQFTKLRQVPTLAAIQTSTNYAPNRISGSRLFRTRCAEDALSGTELFAGRVMIPPTPVSPKTGDGNSGR